MPNHAENKNIRRRRIIDTARELIYKGIDDGEFLPLLSQRASVSTATIYNLIGGRRKIVDAVLMDDQSRVISTIDSMAAATAIERLILSVDLFLDNYSPDPEPYKMMLRTSENSADLRLSGIAFFSKLLREAQDQGYLVKTVDANVLARVVRHLFRSACLDWSLNYMSLERTRAEIKFSIEVLVAGYVEEVHRHEFLATLREYEAVIERLSKHVVV